MRSYLICEMIAYGVFAGQLERAMITMAGTISTMAITILGVKRSPF